MRLEDILEKGYFPKELPPPFTTKQFSDHFKTMSNFKGMVGNSKTSIYSQFSIPKLSYFRTKVALINPYNFLVLAEIIKDNWAEIDTIFNGSSLTTSLPTINTYTYSTQKTFSEFREESLLQSLGKNTLLTTDISRFYSSVYTHSIPWAIHTKPVAKANNSNSLFGNAIDTAVRNCQDKQTNGIPIGPITSLIIAEILLCDIDKKLASSGSIIKGKRYIDDFMLFFNNSLEAEEFFKQLQSLLTDLQLEINSNKTKIEKMPFELDDVWISEISTFISSSYNLKQKNFLTKLYSKILGLVKQYPNKYIIKYLIVILEGIYIERASWDLFQTYLLNLTKLEPSILPNTLSIILSYYSKYSFPVNDIKDFYISLIEQHLEKGNHFEVTWSLWSLLELGVTIDVQTGNKILKSQDWCSKLILFHLEHMGLINGTLTQKSVEKTNINPNDLYDQKWLFIYESFQKGWLVTNSGTHPVMQDTFFKQLKDNNISFYDISERISRLDVDELESNNLLTFEIDNSIITDSLDSIKEKISNAENFNDIKEAYQDLLGSFENFIEDTNSEFSEHIQKLIDNKRDY